MQHKSGTALIWRDTGVRLEIIHFHEMEFKTLQLLPKNNP